MSGKLHGLGEGNPEPDTREGGLQAKSPDPKRWLFWDPVGPKAAPRVPAEGPQRRWPGHESAAGPLTS